MEFCLTEDFHPDDSLVCDLGWRGTIQDSLERIFRSATCGVYLGLYAPFKSQVSSPHGGEKFGVIWNEVLDKQAPANFTFPGPLERGFTLKGAQTIRYVRNRQGKIVSEAVKNDSQKHLSERQASFKEHYPDILKSVAQTFLSFGSFSADTHKIAVSTIASWYENPSTEQADLWFLEKHEEGFGAGDNVHYRNNFPNEKWLGKNLRKTVEKAAQDSFWPQGFLRSSPIVELLNRNRIENA
jgi:hypothetical protein